MARGKTLREQNRRDIARMYLEGKTQDEIAENLEISQATVSRDLRAIRKAWMKDATQDFATKRARQAAELKGLRRKYYDAWHRSLEDSERTTRYVETDKEGNPVPSRMVLQGEARVGNLSALQGAERIWEKYNKLFGLDSPELLQIIDESFDQASWNAEREKRIAAAMKVLDDTEPQG